MHIYALTVCYALFNRAEAMALKTELFEMIYPCVDFFGLVFVYGYHSYHRAATVRVSTKSACFVLTERNAVNNAREVV